MKPKAVIITDPKKSRAICSNQPRVSREQAIRSILAANRRSSLQPSASALLIAAARLWEPAEEG